MMSIMMLNDCHQNKSLKFTIIFAKNPLWLGFSYLKSIWKAWTS